VTQCRARFFCWNLWLARFLRGQLTSRSFLWGFSGGKTRVNNRYSFCSGLFVPEHSRLIPCRQTGRRPYDFSEADVTKSMKTDPFEKSGPLVPVVIRDCGLPSRSDSRSFCRGTPCLRSDDAAVTDCIEDIFSLHSLNKICGIRCRPGGRGVVYLPQGVFRLPHGVAGFIGRRSFSLDTNKNPAIQGGVFVFNLTAYFINGLAGADSAKAVPVSSGRIFGAGRAAASLFQRESLDIDSVSKLAS